MRKAAGETDAHIPQQMSFPPEFVWGAAASSYQNEGVCHDDGRGISIWDLFCRRPGAIADGSNGHPACDQIVRYAEDARLMGEMGLNAYRFDVNWARVLPDGIGRINAQGLDHYDRFVDALLAHSVEPWVELYHWDLPLALHWQGGWLNRDSADWLAELAQVVVDRLSDRVTHWMTVNEPQVFIGAGYRRGANAPGMALADGELLRIAHHVLLAHGKAVQCIRSRAQRPPQIGLALVGFVYIPASESLADIDAARRAMFSLPPARFKNSWFMEPIYRGAYPQDGLDHFLPDAPPILDGDLELISQPLDFLGINIYSGEIVQAHGADGWAPVAEPLGIERTVDGRPVTPQALYWGPRFLYERYGLPIVVTENGLADQDWIHGDGRIHDTKGIDFLDRYLAHLKRAAQDGVPVGGYLVWTLMDNFEFSAGYRPRYGLVHVDFATQKRTWKNSAYWYRDTIAANGANLEVIS